MIGLLTVSSQLQKTGLPTFLKSFACSVWCWVPIYAGLHSGELHSGWVVHSSQLSWVSSPCTYLHTLLFGYVSPINLISLSERRTVDWCFYLFLTCWNLSSKFEMTHHLEAGPRAKTEDHHQPWKLGLTIELTFLFPRSYLPPPLTIISICFIVHHTHC
jgi:hypothetical protein